MRDLTVIMEQVKQQIPQVGEYQLSFFRKPDALQGYEKLPREVVTDIDIASEKMIHRILLNILPEAGFFGEETARQLSDEYTWVVDPIDGTLNFLNGISEWCISIGLLYQGSPVLGLIYRPVSGESFHAVKGGGAWLGETRLPVYGYTSGLQEAFLATGMPFRSPDVSHGFFTTAEALLPKCREIRRLGSAALDLVYCAAGFFQGYWETDLMAYDVCAAIAILQETDLVIQDFFGNPYDLFSSRSLLVARREIIDGFAQIVRTGYSPYMGILLEGFDQTGGKG